ncbi:hypothetical protein LK540_24570 [Massilia sp. IC2-278]|uniref:hypothetical protein n=1 Tax=Massilia sp. IC2-278 TaxID=2887200 RepID=UPI001E3D1F9F|nr:hypothetical protein [Massilia sp. IC2-278]MCC2963618.1 hypothetical protein [Massilia sp. IC2-278]
MDSPVSPNKPALTQPQPRPQRSRLVGSIVAILAMIALGALAWYLTHRTPEGAGGPGAADVAEAG